MCICQVWAAKQLHAPPTQVGVDSAGPLRSLNYLPYAPGSGAGGFRGDAERWPGGGVALYMTRWVVIFPFSLSFCYFFVLVFALCCWLWVMTVAVGLALLWIAVGCRWG